MREQISQAWKFLKNLELNRSNICINGNNSMMLNMGK